MFVNAEACQRGAIALRCVVSFGGGVVGDLAASWSGHGQPLLTGAGRGIVYYAASGSVVDNEMVRDDGSEFDAEVATFAFSAPRLLN